MPTPFYHLSLGEVVLAHPQLAEKTRQFLLAHRCEFLFGNTAADVQVVSGQPRQATHFFNLPIQPGDDVPWERMRQEFPSLRRISRLQPAAVAFLAGYICHLQADWMWVKEIFVPAFGPRCSWGSFRQRLYYHNVLRAYLDRLILPGLRKDLAACLNTMEPKAWLPFVQDAHLTQWRDMLATQLEPGATVQTVEVFSSRQGISAPEYYALLDSEERMREEVFSHLPLMAVDEYRQRVIQENLQLLSDMMVSYVTEPDIPVRIYLLKEAQT